MTTLATPTLFNKQFITGYTGHVPSKNERFGNTAGQTQREILREKGIHPVHMATEPDENRRYGEFSRPEFNKNKMVFGNKSRDAPNWANGPTHMIRRQEVPGYTGHIKGLLSENLFSESFALSTAKAYCKRHPIGINLDPKDKYRTQNSSTFKAKTFRRFSKLS